MNLNDFQKLEGDLPNNLDFFYHPRVSSTQDALKHAYKTQGLQQDTVLLTDFQSNGYGRDGRVWMGLPFPQLLCTYFTTLTLPPVFVSQLPTLSLLTGLSFATTLQAELKQSLQLKWPNDLMYKNKKVGGILVDLLKSKASSFDLLIGFGINLTANVTDWPDDLQTKATALSTSPFSFEQRLHLLKNLLADLKLNLTLFAEKGFAPFHPHIDAMSFLTQKTITLQTFQSLEKGKVLGISPKGELLLEKEDRSVCAHLSGHILSFH